MFVINVALPLHNCQMQLSSSTVLNMTSILLCSKLSRSAEQRALADSFFTGINVVLFMKFGFN